MMVDLHSHVLPGLDDGAPDLEASVAMARAAAADGVEALAATPHVREDYATSPDDMELALALVRKAVAGAGIALEVLPGGEVAIDELSKLAPENLRRFGLGGNPAVILVEFPYVGLRFDLEQRLFELRTQGFVPVLAHPERNPEVQKDPGVLERMVASGTLVQLTAASVDGRLGRRARSAAHALLERRLAHMIASDAHAPEVRAIGMSSAASAVGDAQLARWLTEDVPRAIVDGAAIPERPGAPARRRRLFRR